MPSWIFFTTNTPMLHQLHIDEFSILLPRACCVSNSSPGYTVWNLDPVAEGFNCHFVRLYCAELPKGKKKRSLEWACSEPERYAPSATLVKAERNKNHRHSHRARRVLHEQSCSSSPSLSAGEVIWSYVFSCTGLKQREYFLDKVKGQKVDNLVKRLGDIDPTDQAPFRVPCFPGGEDCISPQQEKEFTWLFFSLSYWSSLMKPMLHASTACHWKYISIKKPSLSTGRTAEVWTNVAAQFWYSGVCEG